MIKENPVANDRVFYCLINDKTVETYDWIDLAAAFSSDLYRDKQEWRAGKKEETMKFVLIVLAVHFVAEMIGRKRKERIDTMVDKAEDIRHPAEFDIR